MNIIMCKIGVKWSHNPNLKGLFSGFAVLFKMFLLYRICSINIEIIPSVVKIISIPIITPKI